MPSAKGKLVRLLSSVMLKQATVVGIQEVGGFRRLLLRCDLQKFAAGARVQLLLPSDDMRTYTPLRSPEGMILLGWKRAGGPGAHWLSNASVNDELKFMGPQTSLKLGAGPVVIVGDETSVAVAAAFANERPGQSHAVIQTESACDVLQAAKSVNLQQLDVVARGDTTATVDAVAAKLLTLPDAVVALTGGSELVVAVRNALRLSGVRSIKTKTYWIPGKTGLD